MGWISNRKARDGGSLNGRPSNNGAKKGPLRTIVTVLSHGKGIFERDHVELECGHDAFTTLGAKRGRCRKCKEAAIRGNEVLGEQLTTEGSKQ